MLHLLLMLKKIWKIMMIIMMMMKMIMIMKKINIIKITCEKLLYSKKFFIFYFV